MIDPKIKLGDVEYVIPKLVIRQNRHVEPLISKHRDYFIAVMQNKGQVKLLDLTDEQAVDFTLIVYHAITRSRPDLTLDQFENLEVSMREIMQALPVCLNQSGLFKEAEPGAPPPGEAPPTQEVGSGSTGTAS